MNGHYKHRQTLLKVQDHTNRNTFILQHKIHKPGTVICAMTGGEVADAVVGRWVVGVGGGGEGQDGGSEVMGGGHVGQPEI